MKYSALFSIVLLVILVIFFVYLLVAIVGGGVGGSGVSYFLNELTRNKSKSSPLDVYIYEATERIGGRVHAVNFAGEKYEAGASIIHGRNKYAISLLEKLHLTKRRYDSECPGKFSALTGIFDGETCVLQESSSRIGTLLKFAWHFGFDLIRVFAVINRMLDSFDLVYSKHSRGLSFQTVHGMLEAMDLSFVNMTEMTAHEYFSNKLKLHDRTIEHLINSATLVNYGQNVRTLPAFVASVATAGTDLNSQLWSVEGGNELLAQRMANESGANIFLNEPIAKITKNSNGTYTLVDNSNQEKVFDSVVIAHPLALSKMEFEEFCPLVMKKVDLERAKKYHKVLATFVRGRRNIDDSYCSTSDILVCKDNFRFQSVGFNTPVDSTKGQGNCSSVYKIFSPSELDNGLLNQLFNETEEKKVIEWKAYPEFKVGQVTRDDGPSFQLDEGLYYVNAVEWAASAIEMSLIGAKNVALLTFKYLEQKGLL